MMGIDTTVSNALIMFTNVIDECIRFEDSIVCKKCAKDNVIIEAQLFIILFCVNRLWPWESKFMFNMNITTQVINKDASTNVCLRVDP